MAEETHFNLLSCTLVMSLTKPCDYSNATLSYVQLVMQNDMFFLFASGNTLKVSTLKVWEPNKEKLEQTKLKNYHCDTFYAWL